MKAFHFKQFSIIQSKDVFRVGTDAVLLGALATCENHMNILEVGTGTGLISLMLAQRNKNATILAIDIDRNAVELSQKNFQHSPYKSRISVEEKNFKSFHSPQCFDLIICNPPYFEKNSSKKDVLARQQIELNFDSLIEISSQYLSENGVLSVIIPKKDEEYFVKKARQEKLHLFRKVDIKGMAHSNVKRCVLEFSSAIRNLQIEHLIMETSPRVYSDEYLELTKDFHLFNK